MTRVMTFDIDTADDFRQAKVDIDAGDDFRQVKVCRKSSSVSTFGQVKVRAVVPRSGVTNHASELEWTFGG